MIAGHDLSELYMSLFVVFGIILLAWKVQRLLFYAVITVFQLIGVDELDQYLR